MHACSLQVRELWRARACMHVSQSLVRSVRSCRPVLPLGVRAGGQLEACSAPRGGNVPCKAVPPAPSMHAHDHPPPPLLPRIQMARPSVVLSVVQGASMSHVTYVPCASANRAGIRTLRARCLLLLLLLRGRPLQLQLLTGAVVGIHFIQEALHFTKGGPLRFHLSDCQAQQADTPEHRATEAGKNERKTDEPTLAPTSEQAPIAPTHACTRACKSKRGERPAHTTHGGAEGAARTPTHTALRARPGSPASMAGRAHQHPSGYAAKSNTYCSGGRCVCRSRAG